MNNRKPFFFLESTGYKKWRCWGVTRKSLPGYWRMRDELRELVKAMPENVLVFTTEEGGTDPMGTL